MRRVVLRLLGLLVVAGVAVPVMGHEAYPARLDLVEVEPGLYDVAFSLPIVEGRKLRAEPLLPPSCEEVTARETGLTSSGVTTTWRVRCTPPSLAGEVVLIDGLLGTQTDLAVKISALNGRVHSAILRPSRPGLLVPSPPSVTRLALDAAVAGMRRVLERVELWVLLLIVACGLGGFGVDRRSAAAGIVAFAAAHLVGQWLAAKTWLQISSHIPTAFALLSALPPALALVSTLPGREPRTEEEPRDWLHPWWGASLLLGLLYGGARPVALPSEGLSRAEQSLASILFTAGVGLGMLLLWLVAREVGILLERTADGRFELSGRRRLGFLTGIVAVGLLGYLAAVLPILSAVLPLGALALVLFGAVLGPALSNAGVQRRAALAMVACGLGVGLVLGLSGRPFLFVALGPLAPLGDITVAGSLFFFAVCVATRVRPAPSWLFPVTVAACIAHGWQLGYTLGENVSRPVGTAMGTVLVTICVLYASLSMARAAVDRATTRTASIAVVRAAAGAVALLAALWQLGEVGAWLDERFATEAALGLIRLPLLSLALVITAAVVWPRRRRVLARLGIEERRRKAHWVFLGLAFFLVPVGTTAVRNPFYEARAPEGEAARRLMTRVLSDTYHAFNIEDEDELFDRLAESVTDDLVADLYLDSRRRLTAGTRAGAEVTVREVSVLDIGEARRARDAGEARGHPSSATAFAYDCRWVVTARVRHLQHIHHRQNIYNGVLTIEVVGDRWKIAGVDLRTEDRVVLPWQPT